MLVIRSIRVEFDKRVIPIRIRNVRVGYKDAFAVTERKYYQIDTHNFVWEQDMTLPIFYNVPLQFICPPAAHNSESPEDVPPPLTCSLKIVNYRQTEQETHLLNHNNQKVAKLTLKYKVLNEKMIVPSDRGSLIIETMLAHFQHHQGEQGFIDVMLGFKQVVTPTLPFIAGELLWSQPLILPLEDVPERDFGKQVIQFNVIADGEPIAIGTCKVGSLTSHAVKYKKIPLKDHQNSQMLGTLFIDVKYKPQGGNAASPLTIPKHNSQTIDTSQYSSFKTPMKNSKSVALLASHKSKELRQNHKSVGLLNALKEKESQQTHRSESQMEIGRSRFGAGQWKSEKKVKMKNADIFNGVFNLGEKLHEENIRQILKERRGKKKKQGGLPRLK